jgi:hypothetical protein
MKFQYTHVGIAVLVIIGAIILYYMFISKPVHNEGIVSVGSDVRVPTDDVNDLIDKLKDEENAQHPITSEEVDVDDDTRQKLEWKNKAKSGQVNSNYKDGMRGNTPMDEWNEFYKMNTDLVDKSYIQNNDAFQPLDETRGNLATADSGEKKKHTPEDLFKVDKLLPQEANPDWFEVMPEPIKVKNRHLINVTRPVGINTIGSSLKVPNYDLRPSPACPKFVVSPWNNSSFNPSLESKGLN